MIKQFIAAAMAFALSAAPCAQVLSLEEAVRLALTQQPILQSYEAAGEAAQQAAIAEGQLPDPELTLGVQNLPITGNDALQFDRDDMTMSTVGVMQDMVRPAKRAASANRMEAEARQWGAQYSLTTRTIRREVALAWLDVFEAERKADLYRQMAEEMAAERRVAATRLASVGAEGQEIFRLDTVLSMNNDTRLVSLRDAKKARAVLTRWIGVDAANRPLPADLPPLATSPDGGASAALDHHPALQVAQRAQEAAQWAAERARADRAPDWSWELMYGRRWDGLSDMVTVQVAIDLPWDRAQRQDRRLAEKLALVEQARELGADRQRELVAELESVRADWETAAMREREHLDRLIPAAQSRLALTKAAYSAGQTPLSAIWEARRGVLEVDMEHWMIKTDQARAAVRLAYLSDDVQGEP